MSDTFGIKHSFFKHYIEFYYSLLIEIVPSKSIHLQLCFAGYARCSGIFKVISSKRYFTD